MKFLKWYIIIAKIRNITIAKFIQILDQQKFFSITKRKNVSIHVILAPDFWLD